MTTVQVVIEGSLCGHEALALAGTLGGTRLSGADHVVLSLARIERADAAGLALLLRLYSHLRVRGKTLSVRDASNSIRAMLRELGLSELFERSEPEARPEPALIMHTAVMGSAA